MSFSWKSLRPSTPPTHQERDRRRRRIRFGVASVALAAVMAGGGAVVGTAAAPIGNTVDIGSIDAILDNQAVTDANGGNRNTSKGCLTYSPQKAGDANHGNWVTTPDTSWSRGGHGALTNWLNQLYCTFPTLDNKQSIMSVSPAKGGTITLGTPFLLGSISHANNEVANDGTAIGDSWFFGGDFSFRMNKLGHTVTFPWLLEETRDASGVFCPTGAIIWGKCNDRITFLNGGESNPTVKIDGAEYRMMISQVERLGVDSNQAVMEAKPCPATPTNVGATTFTTDEDHTTKACVYATLVQERPLTVKKVVTGTAAPAGQGFSFTATSTRVASPWLGAGSTFSLKHGESTTARGVLAGEKLTFTEGSLADPGWRVSALQCVDGLGSPIGNTTYDLAARRITLSSVPQAASPEEAPITCTVTNTYGNEASLTLVKKVVGGDAQASEWTLTATRNGTTALTGTSGVTKSTLNAGEYVLSEAGGPKGYVSDGWTCVSNDGAAAPEMVTADTVALPMRSSVTCTVTNVYTTGTFTVTKTLDLGAGVQAPVALTNPSATFPMSYDCTLPDGTTKSGKLDVALGKTEKSPELPVGTTCDVTEESADKLPALANAGYSWGGVSFTVDGKAATQVNGRTVTVTIAGDKPGASKAVAIGVANTVEAGDFTVHKVDEKGNLLDGAAFRVCADVNGNKACVLPAMTKPSAGVFTMNALTPATYWLQEQTAPNGYTKLSDWVKFTVAADGTVAIDPASENRLVSLDGRTIVVTNLPTPVEVLKVSGGDASKAVPLDGASFLVYPLEGASAKLPAGAVPVAGASYRVNPADLPVYEALAADNPAWNLAITADPTVTTGKVQVDGLKEGVGYLLVEMVAPDGHALLAEPVPFRLLSGRIVEIGWATDHPEASASGNRITVTDYVPVDLPFAGADQPWPVLATLLVLFGAVAGVSVRRSAHKTRREPVA